MTDPRIAGRYRPLRVLGAGAMGEVLLALDEATGDELALKVIKDAATAHEKSVLQFQQEFRLMTRLRHPNCCAVYDYGLAGPAEPFFTMEVVPGAGLDERLPLAPDAFVPAFAQLMLALGYVHQQGLVHLDVKAANVRVTGDGTVKLMDYGLMEYAGAGAGVIRGTLPYVSPEMARRAPVDARSDLYSAGVLAYELLTGRLPFERRTAVEVLRAHLGEDPTPPARLVPGLPPELDRLVLRLLAKEPVQRPQSAGEVLEALGYEAPPGIGGSLFGSSMVGREDALQRLLDGLEALQAGRAAGVVAIAGPPGIGKTRLVEAFRVHVQLAHVAYAQGAWHAHQRLPYAGVLQLLRGLLPEARQHAPEALATAAPVLVKLLPELAVPPAPDMESPRHEMLRLQAAVADLLGALAAARPVVAVLENWQWADEPARELVTYLRRNLADAPLLLLLVGARDDEAAGALALAALDAAALRRMVCNMLGSEQVEPAFCQAIGELAAANPLYVEHLLEALVGSGALVRRGGRWNTELDPRTQALPATLDALVIQELAALPADALRVARVAAAYERPAPIEFLAAASGLVDAPLFDALAALQRAQVLAADADQAWGFVQHRERDVLYAQLGAAERTALHGAIADALLAEAADRAPDALPGDLVVAIATHAALGDRPEPAIAYNLEAGRRAVALFALADAEAFLAKGLRFLEAAGERPRTRLAYVAELGEARRQAGVAREALTWLGQAAALAEELGEQGQLGTLLMRMAACHQMDADYDRAVATAERSAALCLAAGDPAGAARALRVVGRVHFFRGEPAAAQAVAERALALAQESGKPGILGLAYALAGFLAVAAEPEPARVAAGVERLRAAVALLTEVGDRVGLNDAYNLLGNAEMMLGEPGPARAAFEASAVICRQNGLQEEACVALVSLATTAVELGDFGEARRQAGEVRALAGGIDAKLPLGMAMAIEGLAAAYLGDLARVDGPTDEALALARGIGNRYLEAVAGVPRIEALVLLGRAEAALAAGADLAALSGESEGPRLAWQAIAETQLGRAAAGLATAGRARAIADRAGAKSLLVLIGLAEAGALAALERWAEARDTATAALAAAEALGLRGRAAELQGLLGEVALAQGTPDAAGRFEAQEALALALAAPALAAQARFGRAAAKPYASEAEALAQGAGTALRQLAAGLPPADAARWLGLPAVARAIAGNYLAFSLPRQRRQGPPTGGFGLNLAGL